MNNSAVNSGHGPWFSRRAVLSLGQLPVLGLGLAAMGQTTTTARARNCILIWLDGGPSHLETFDLKPDAPPEVRGPLQPIATSVPGVFISECLPQLAQRFSDVAVIRSMTSPLGEHNLGTQYLMSGYRPTPVLEYPSFLTVAHYSQRRLSADSDLPVQVAVPDFRVGGSRFSGHGFLPVEYGPFSLSADPASRDFRVRDLEPPAGLSLENIARRRQFAKKLAEFGEEQGLRQPANPAMERAFRMVTSAAARSAFRLDEEPTEVRRRYGMKTVGQSCLMARRLVERGVRYVTVNYRGWDTHADLYTRLKEGFTGAKVGVGLIPSLDLAVSALLDDLKDRGLLDETLIVIMGEFGRTPKLNAQGGRDHWPRAFSAALAGGGIRGGTIIGRTDAVGESPSDHPVTPADLIATVYSLLGVDLTTTFHTSTGRPIRSVSDDAKPVEELIS